MCQSLGSLRQVPSLEALAHTVGDCSQLGSPQLHCIGKGEECRTLHILDLGTTPVINTAMHRVGDHPAQRSKTRRSTIATTKAGGKLRTTLLDDLHNILNSHTIMVTAGNAGKDDAAVSVETTLTLKTCQRSGRGGHAHARDDDLAIGGEATKWCRLDLRREENYRVTIYHSSRLRFHAIRYPRQYHRLRDGCYPPAGSCSSPAYA